ncbi:fructose-bisphosphate aldolase, class II [Loktanella sp. DSM 29012]|uniref:class II fructose-bisphosphate aldolase n=1 Tax=Loktanella sp. DSM 29012 TaxID=1881056 RepID=UPI0008C9F6B8|nr:class II fructose-bisphosphate aldolase [Loktanella sp. DSM 29012]SEQ80986.1 fructose-bisphosphate aldolase, class II [Loktanella sp. DSM 29012]
MTLATLSDVLIPARDGGYAIAGLVCQGWEDMRAYVTAAEAERAPVILQAGPGCRAHTPLPVLAGMMRHLAEAASVPVVIHLDHAHSLDECRAAIDLGFTSVMFDGSRLPLADNMAQTAQVVRIAQAAGVSCEGEIGFVGYDAGVASIGTDPAEAATFARDTGVDALAVSVGNVHLQQGAGAALDEARIHAIAALTDVPLVIHGGSGVPPVQRSALARGSNICKFNIGTELRMTFGAALRQNLVDDDQIFDRIDILSATEASLCAAARRIIASLGVQSRHVLDGI